MFKGKSHHKSGGGIFGIFRLFLSFIILGVLGIGLLQAYKSFSGYDPLKVSPTSLQNLFTSQGAYEFVIGLLNFNPQDSLGNGSLGLGSSSEPGENETPNEPPLFKIAVIADSHKDTANLEKVLAQAKASGVKFVIMMGDLSDVGTKDELSATKQKLDSSGMTYYVAAGDHDLWDSRNQKQDPSQNFKDTFGSAYQSFSYENTRFLILYNSDNYLGVDELEMKWIEDELDRAQIETPQIIFAFAPTPLYHPSSDHVMGKETPKLKDQALHLISILKKGGVDQVFSADTHFFTKYTEPTQDLAMLTVGAITQDRNAQTPRFALVDIYSNGSYNIQETEVK